jgi:transposase-like protein
MSSNRPCDRCGSTHLRTKPYRRDYFTGPEGSFDIKSKIVYLCEDCQKTIWREMDPQIKRLYEAQKLLDGKGDIIEEEEEE